MKKKIVNPLFFEDKYMKEHVIAEVQNMEETFKEIYSFCSERDYKIYAIRFWIEETSVENEPCWKITFDVGSWSEFFNLYFDTFEQAEAFRNTVK